MDNQTTGMDAGIGPPGRVQPDRRAENLLQRFFNHFLNRKAIELSLPADISAAIVFNHQSYFCRHISHQTKTAPNKHKNRRLGKPPGLKRGSRCNAAKGECPTALACAMRSICSTVAASSGLT